MAITIEYCKKYNSYNGKEVGEGECLAPVLFSEEMITSDDSVIRENLKTWTHFGVKFKVGFMVVKTEDFPKMLALYNNCINNYFDEHPEKKRGRCVLSWDEYGYPILCSKENKCIGCPHRYEDLPRYKNLEDFLKFESLDAPIENEDGEEQFIDVPDTKSGSVEDMAMLGVLLDQLLEYLEKVDARYVKVVELRLSKHTNQEIFDAIGLKSSRGYDVLHDAEAAVRKFLDL